MLMGCSMMGTIYHARTRGSLMGANDGGLVEKVYDAGMGGEVNMDMLDRLDAGVVVLRGCWFENV